MRLGLFKARADLHVDARRPEQVPGFTCVEDVFGVGVARSFGNRSRIRTRDSSNCATGPSAMEGRGRTRQELRYRRGLAIAARQIRGREDSPRRIVGLQSPRGCADDEDPRHAPALLVAGRHDHARRITGVASNPTCRRGSRRGEWVPWARADEGRPVKPGTVEAWARDATNPVRGYYGLRKGYRGRFANYVAPVLELLGFAELEHGPRNNRIKAVGDRTTR